VIIFVFQKLTLYYIFIRSIMANPAPEVINLDEDVPPAINVGGNNIRSNRFDRIAFVYPESGGNSAIQVRESDVSRLNPNQQISENKSFRAIYSTWQERSFVEECAQTEALVCRV
jgi:hypothetical protein